MPDGVLSYESSAAHAHLGHLQAIVGRMADSANACKFWCVALISAVLVVIGLGQVSEEPLPGEQVLLAFLPGVALLFLNAYYHSQELRFRRAYEAFVGRLAAGSAERGDLFCMPDNKGAVCRWVRSLRSISIWPFYSMVGIVIVLAWKVVL